jgi:hypothetical protein
MAASCSRATINALDPDSRLVDGGASVGTLGSGLGVGVGSSDGVGVGSSDGVGVGSSDGVGVGSSDGVGVGNGSGSVTITLRVSVHAVDPPGPDTVRLTV